MGNSYALGRSRHLPDGTKRIAIAVMNVLLLLHGREIVSDEAEVAAVISSLTDASITEYAFAAWLDSQIRTGVG
jgi:prophage maintenance system killer protein